MASNFRGPVFRAIVETSASRPLVSAAAGQKIRVLALALSFNGSVNARFQSTTPVSPPSSVDISGPIYGAANVSVVWPFNEMGWCDTNVGEQLDLLLSAGQAVGGVVTYTLVP